MSFIQKKDPEFYSPLKLEKAWGELNSGKINNALLRPEIAASWERCQDFSIKPHDTLHTPPKAPAQIMEENRLLAETALPHMRKLLDLVQGLGGYVVMLYSPDGYILDIFGDRKMYSLAESLNVFPGVNNAEQSIGTAAPGICISEGISVQVLRLEHYCQVYHDWCCSAAPVRNRQGELIGILDVTNTDPSRHPASVLSLVQLTARAIESEFNYRDLESDGRQIYSFFESMVNGGSEAVIVCDKYDQVTHLNKPAQRLLGVKADEVLGRDAHSIISNYDSVKQGLGAGRHLAELHFFAPPASLALTAKLKMGRQEATGRFALMGVLRKNSERRPESDQLRYGFQDFIHASPVSASVLEEAKNVADSSHTVLIHGESGTGKEILAQAIHQYGTRQGGPFVALNCAALPKDLITSELFGYEGGAFTGAARSGQAGKFELAEGGSLFLDEIGDMPLEAQAILLRVLQEKSLVRIGGSRPRPLNVRIIAATNKNLGREAEAGRFRSDLYYRLSVISLFVPPLRERREDLRPLIDYFVEKHSNGEYGPGDLKFERPARDLMMKYGWPGNVRELESAVIHFLTKMRNRTVSPDDLPSGLAGPEVSAEAGDLQVLECRAIRAALNQCDGHMTRTAKMLGISRATLYRKLEKYGLARQGI